MEPLDVIEHISPGHGQRPIATSVDAFALELAEEALGSGVVGAVAHIAHAAEDVVIFQELLVLGAGELSAAV